MKLQSSFPKSDSLSRPMRSTAWSIATTCGSHLSHGSGNGVTPPIFPTQANQGIAINLLGLSLPKLILPHGGGRPNLRQLLAGWVLKVMLLIWPESNQDGWKLNLKLARFILCVALILCTPSCELIPKPPPIVFADLTRTINLR